MSLPILKVTTALSPAALARQYVQSELMMSQALVEPLPIEVQAFCAPELAAMPEANRVLDAYVVDMGGAERVVRAVNDAFALQGCAVQHWSINPTTPAEVKAELDAFLLADGFTPDAVDLLLLNRPAVAAAEPGELQVVPARSSYALSQRLLADSSLPNAKVLAQAVGLWLDEPRLDSLLALRAGVPVGLISVLTMGQVGRVMHLFVAEAHRRQGIGSELLRRAMELCARSLFHHVFATAEDAHTRRLLEQFGFGSFGIAERYVRG